MRISCLESISIAFGEKEKAVIKVFYLCISRTAVSVAADCFRYSLQAGQSHPPTFPAIFVYHCHCAWPEDPPRQVITFIFRVAQWLIMLMVDWSDPGSRCPIPLPPRHHPLGRVFVVRS